MCPWGKVIFEPRSKEGRDEACLNLEKSISGKGSEAEREEASVGGAERAGGRVVCDAAREMGGGTNLESLLAHSKVFGDPWKCPELLRPDEIQSAQLTLNFRDTITMTKIF